MPFVHEKVTATPQTYISQHKQALCIAATHKLSQYCNVKVRWIDSQKGLVLYELFRDGGPGWLGAEFILFVGEHNIRFSCSWPNYPIGEYNCEVYFRDSSSNGKVAERLLQSAITDAMHAYCIYDFSAMAEQPDEFSLVFK